MNQTIQQLTCKRCGATWWPKSSKPPERCAKCNSQYYDRERKLQYAIDRAKSRIQK